ncbi:GCN5-related N-acetyltransferase [Pseudomonas tremae]|uniref:L-methionine sulfoximine/L-methionine sulfone acetyltransferase n=6 Tax=Pseudomonas syringae group TaxID=136849 RepID=A0AB37QNS3_9PSED|nr:GCN5-related N-acetyltransferase [Pseudomonas coronafaciens pv. atropurpurea]KPX34930.1 GCN5-related N-acetyltransferase [Pseudomonas coronafaciens pv. garcae]KPY03840.1 GCN5-related N-acetyltransferase [Pseudomonas coronafaciens pv. oryzae]KPY20888.1 GCN5-related N-acetyltransferase [Pseudomonas coronafaciens pv. porri]KPZ02797.1 GCN5-related N-acetyltransferase [Pseudomonas tremae]KPZ28896.1 GCN5-related N-acetyltransferase [Pseudomonas coronafaciens pv. zizaniae]RMN97947.1 GCN5-related 
MIMQELIRDALPGDLPGILAIYNDAVLNTTAIWNEQPVDLANRQAWYASRQAQGYPILIAIDSAGDVLGYSSFGDWRPFEGFRHTVEHSVYVRADQRGKGLGPRLMAALIERARTCDKHMMVAAIESGNAASIALHDRLGFKITGQMPQVGTKFGRWLDLTFMQLDLSPGAAAPASQAPAPL